MGSRVKVYFGEQNLVISVYASTQSGQTLSCFHLPTKILIILKSKM